ncbi:DNA methylase [Escherichia coli]|uniref:DNA-methyltransferase n=1 Tax=Escherichia coli TaxID=562 RepID=UPI00191B849C|nr:site-specific DNA-methyltransferase [Escherichia coli]MDS1690697.1 site-specific DNA-methyltransferase [Escherichia coli]UMS67160.1 site-specific DNA-methyltransferase [Escherichia coli]CAD6110526.1 DNA methylase [Escherichia coli]
MSEINYRALRDAAEVILHHEDCFDVFPDIRAGSIDLIVCDPPYGTVGGMGVGERRYSSLSSISWDTAIKPETIFRECERVLRVNGIMILFSQEPYTSRLINNAINNLPFRYRMVWLKDHFANCLLAKKAPVSYFEDVLVFSKQWDSELKHPLRNYSKKVIKYIGKKPAQIIKETSNKNLDHFLRYNSCQFLLCTEESYLSLTMAFKITEMPGYMDYSELKRIDSEYKLRYQRVFNLPEGKKIMSNVLKCRKVRNGLHPMQKPVPLLEELIKTYSNPGDMVLDFTMGSGSTGVACKNTGRNFIGIEKERKYYDIACQQTGIKQDNVACN